MKKVIFILLGISFILGGIIFVLYKNNYSKSDDVVDIFKEKDDSDNNSNDDIIEEMKDDTNTVIVDIKGMVVNPVYMRFLVVLGLMMLLKPLEDYLMELILVRLIWLK